MSRHIQLTLTTAILIAAIIAVFCTITPVVLINTLTTVTLPLIIGEALSCIEQNHKMQINHVFNCLVCPLPIATFCLLKLLSKFANYVDTTIFTPFVSMQTLVCVVK